MMVSTTNEIIGFKAVRHLGIVRGITVRSRSVVGNFVGGIQSIFGGQIGAYVELAESARQEAFDHMCAHAAQAGANAVIGMRYDANDIMEGITEVLAYGTAVGSSLFRHKRLIPQAVAGLGEIPQCCPP